MQFQKNLFEFVEKYDIILYKFIHTLMLVKNMLIKIEIKFINGLV